MINYPYLSDEKFLKEFDEENYKIQYTRILVLDFQTEAVLARIEGKATGGSVTINGNSTMRRIANCSLLVDPKGVKTEGAAIYQQYSNLTEIQNLISLNKKIRLETGFVNSLAYKGSDYYSDYEIIWFPLGTYVIKTASIVKSNSGTNISLTLHDKSVILNGDLGGVIPAATVFSEQEIVATTSGRRNVEKILIKDIIKKLLVEFAGEAPENVIIEDIPDYIKKVMKWTGKAPCYLITGDSPRLVLTKPTDFDSSKDMEIKYGDFVGYMTEPFVYPGKLECNAGETVSSILNKIKNTLGNFEWFYDIYGKFHFREIKNYLNNAITTDLLNLSESDYFMQNNFAKTRYVFDENNKHLITSISSAPQYQNIKNDFIVWGSEKTASGGTRPLRYHLAFDKKPEVTGQYHMGFIQKASENNETFVPLYFSSDTQHDKNAIFYTENTDALNKNYYYLVRKWREKEEE